MYKYFEFGHSDGVRFGYRIRRIGERLDSKTLRRMKDRGETTSPRT